MKPLLKAVARMLAIWLALLGGWIVAGVVIPFPAGTVPTDGPLGPLEGFLIFNAIAAAVLSALAARLSGSFAARAAVLFLVLFVVESLLSLVEALYFAPFVAMPESQLLAVAAANLVRASAGALVAAWLWPGTEGTRAPRTPVWAFPVAVGLYILAYFGAGYLIAWQSEAVRTYYGDGIEIDSWPLLFFQVGRGSVWVALAWLLVRRLTGSLQAKAMLTGAAFALFMAAPLLLPNEFMPWPVRRIHMLELIISNFLFGVGAILLLGLESSEGRKGT